MLSQQLDLILLYHFKKTQPSSQTFGTSRSYHQSSLRSYYAFKLLFPPIFNMNTANTILLLFSRDHALIVDCCHSAPWFFRGVWLLKCSGLPSLFLSTLLVFSLAATGLSSPDHLRPEPRRFEVLHAPQRLCKKDGQVSLLERRPSWFWSKCFLKGGVMQNSSFWTLNKVKISFWKEI